MVALRNVQGLRMGVLFTRLLTSPLSPALAIFRKYLSGQAGYKQMPGVMKKIMCQWNNEK